MLFRSRGEPTFEIALKEFEKLKTWAPVFLSYELLHLYRHAYLQQISQQLKFPVDFEHPRLNEILIDDTNSKYFNAVEYHPTDDLAKHASRKKWQ